MLAVAKTVSMQKRYVELWNENRQIYKTKSTQTKLSHIWMNYSIC